MHLSTEATTDKCSISCSINSSNNRSYSCNTHNSKCAHFRLLVTSSSKIQLLR
uniref:Uncharacterized protein n=1 Tax=Octopus bimaculoides TaxID=37653 RepID=A0A0L8GFI3_OCTBM